MKAFSDFPENYQLIFDVIPDILFLVESSGVIIDVKCEHPETLFKPPDAFPGKKVDQVLPEAVSNTIMEALDQAFRTEAVQSLTYPLLENGQESIYEVRLIANREADVAIAIIRDITDGVTKDQDSTAERGEYGLIFEKMQVGFAHHEMLFDDQDNPVDYRFLTVNPAFEQMTGLKADDIIGRTVLEIMPDLDEIWIETYGEIAQTGKSVSFEQYSSPLDRHYRVSAFQTERNHFATNFYDITQEKQYEARLNANAAELRVSERRLKEAQKIANLGVWEYDHAGDHLVWSDEIYRIFGLEPGVFEETYEAFLDRVHPDDRDAVFQAYADSLENHRNYEIDHRVVTLSGEIKHVHEYCETDFDSQGQPIRSLGVVMDITQFKTLQDSLMTTSGKLSAIIEYSPLLISEFTPEGEYLMVSQGYQEAGHFKEHISVGKRFADLFPAEIVQVFSERISRVVETRKSLSVQDLIPSDQGDKHYLTTLFPLFDDQGEVRTLGSIAQDITELKEAAEEIRQSEERFRTLMETAPVGMAIYQNGRFVMFNHRAVEMLGAKNETELLDRDISDFVLPQDLPKVQARIEGIYQRVQKDEPNLELFIRCFDGKLREFEIIGNLTTYDQASALQISIIDITHRRQHEAERQARLRELEALESLTLALEGDMDLETALATVLAESLKALNLGDGLVLLFSDDSQQPSHQKSTGWMTALRELPLIPEQSLAFDVMRSGETMLVEKFEHPNPDAAELVPEGWGLIGAPIQTSTRTIGVMWAAYEPTRQLETGEIQMFNAMARMAGISIHRIWLHQQSLREMEILQAQHAIDRAVANLYDFDLTLEIICEQGCKFLPADAVSLLLYQEHSMSLEYAESSGFMQTPALDFKTRLGEGCAGQAALDRKTIHIKDLPAALPTCRRHESFIREGFLCYSAVPLLAKGQLKGVLEVFHRQPFAHEASFEQRANSLGYQAAVAIDDLQLYNRLKRNNLELLRAYDSTIEGWSLALDLRDQETEGHTLRVTELTLKLARWMGIDEEELVHIRRGALLHDMGKMGIPDSILLKPAALTDEEWDIMRQHPDHAFKMLSPIAYLRPAIDIPYCHHEKWDGTGYPRGLKGTQIPLAARIFAVVDVYDALTSDRPYRDAWPHKKALEHIQQGAGSHFDPQVVEAFLKVVSS